MKLILLLLLSALVACAELPRGFIGQIMEKSISSNTSRNLGIPALMRCWPGYSLNFLNICEPNCEVERCQENEHCTAPNVCDCRHGYKRHTHDATDSCQAVCTPDCGHRGYCKAPNICGCEEGFMKLAENCVSTCVGDFVWHSSLGRCVRRCNFSPWTCRMEEEDDCLDADGCGRPLIKWFNICHVLTYIIVLLCLLILCLMGYFLCQPRSRLSAQGIMVQNDLYNGHELDRNRIMVF